jgi:hypothetical protein
MMNRRLRSGTLLVVILLGAPACASALEFVEPPGSPYQTTETHFVPNSAEILGGATGGDFNGDGIDDLAVVDETGLPAFSSGESVTVFLGHRGGGLTMAPGSPLALYSGGMFASSGAIAVGDFDGDHKLDLAVVDNVHQTVSILLGDGTGRFHLSGAPIPYAGGGEPNAIAVGDFTGSGVQDLAFASGGKVDVLLGDGSGGFVQAPESPFAVPGEAQSLATGNFDSDGRSDLAVTTRQNQVVVYRAVGGGRFQAVGSPLATSEDPNSIVAADLTADGKIDLATANTEAGTVTVLLGDGADRFAPATGSPFPVPEGTGPTRGMPGSIVAGDFDGDRRMDLAVANFNGYSDDIAVLRGDGRGGFENAPGSPFPAHGDPRPQVVGDFNGDQRPDLAVVNSFEGTVTVLENATSSEEPPPTAGQGGPKPAPPPRAPHPAGASTPTRAALHALIASQTRAIAVLAARRRSVLGGTIGIDLKGLEAGVAIVEWHAVPHGRRGRHGRAVLLASGRLAFVAATSERMRLHLTAAGRRLWRRGGDLRLMVRETFAPTGQEPISATTTVRPASAADRRSGVRGPAVKGSPRRTARSG